MLTNTFSQTRPSVIFSRRTEPPDVLKCRRIDASDERA
jgi:hypothetical protein